MTPPHLRDPNDIARDIQQSLGSMSDAEFKQVLESTLKRGGRFPPIDNDAFSASLKAEKRLHYEAVCNHCLRLYSKLEAKKGSSRALTAFFVSQTVAHLQWIRSYRKEHRLK